MSKGTFDFSSLKKLYLSVSDVKPEGMEMLVPLSDMLHSDRIGQVLELGVQKYKALNFEMPASLVGLSYFNLCGTLYYLSAIHNSWLDLSIPQLQFYVVPQVYYLDLGYYIPEPRISELPTLNREEVLRQSLEIFITETLRPLVEQLSKRADVKPEMIWYQWASRLLQIRNYMMEQDIEPEVRDRIISDFKLLTEQLLPELFGCRRNPLLQLRPVYVDSPYQPGKQVLIRSACCMYYSREGGELCFNCPKMKPADREIMREKIIASR